MAAPGAVPSQRSRVRVSRGDWQSFCGGGHLQRLSAERCSRAPLSRGGRLGTRPGRRETYNYVSRELTAPNPQARAGYRGERRGRAPPTSPGTVPDAVAATEKGKHKGDYSDDVQAGGRRQRFFRADGFFAAGFLDLDFLDLDGRPTLSGGATTVLMTPRR